MQIRQLFKMFFLGVSALMGMVKLGAVETADACVRDCASALDQTIIAAIERSVYREEVGHALADKLMEKHQERGLAVLTKNTYDKLLDSSFQSRLSYEQMGQLCSFYRLLLRRCGKEMEILCNVLAGRVNEARCLSERCGKLQPQLLLKNKQELVGIKNKAELFTHLVSHQLDILAQILLQKNINDLSDACKNAQCCVHV